MSNNASPIMEKLYGKEQADKVYNRLESLNVEFNRAVQDIACDYFWALPGLNLKDKSFITLVSLIVLHKEEQTKIHYYGFLNSDGTKEELVALLEHLKQFVNIETVRKLLAEVLSEFGENLPNVVYSLSPQYQEMANLAAAAALGDKEKMKVAMQHYLDKYTDALEKIQHIFMHQIVYCGFPVAMNGFAELKTLL